MTFPVSMFAPPFVYVMKSGDLYKIGYSTQPGKRLQALRNQLPEPVELLGVVEGGRELEASWHRHFRDKRVRGEWFRLASEDVDIILGDWTNCVP